MIELIDATSSSLTVSWPKVAGASRYVLQYRKAVCGDKVTFETLSNKLASTQARKRNLDFAGGYFFRVGAAEGEEDDDNVKSWVSHNEAFQILSEDQESGRMETPTTVPAGNQALLIKWKKHETSSYELQMRENDGGAKWNTIAASLSSTEVRKKNLTSPQGYQFRVRPAGSDAAFSSPSDPAVALGLSRGMKQLFGSLEEGKLLKDPQTSLPLADALGGKEFVLLYASAHWCGPCRQFTPMLSKWYQSNHHQNAEVVFLSCDHDQKGFDSYFNSMPWLAVPYDDDARESLLGYIRVTGIPRLVVLDGKTGKTLVDNAVGQPLDINQWRRLATK